jgi:hypothetical protein
MTFKPAIWYPIAVLLSVVNLVAVWFATVPAQPWHATIHAVLALASGVWAHRLRQGPGGRERQVGLDAVEALDALEAVEAEASKLRQELNETQERLDFAERLLAQRPDPRRVDPQR